MSVAQRNHVTVMGDGGQPMVFAHGYGCDQRMWRLVAPAFAETHQVVLFDHVGSGRSDLSAYDPVKYRSLQAYADDLLEICRELDLRDVVYVGHSVSGMIGLLAAIKEPDRFDRLVLLGPSPCYLDLDDYSGGFSRKEIEELLDFQERNYLGWSRMLAPVIMDNLDRPELAEELTASMCQTDPAIARQFAAVTFLSDNRADLSKVTTPALIVQTDPDAIAPLAVGQYVHAHLPRSEFTLLDAAGHCPHLSAPDQTIAAIERFLRR